VRASHARRNATASRDPRRATHLFVAERETGIVVEEGVGWAETGGTRASGLLLKCSPNCCPSRQGEQCSCTPSFRAVAWSHRDQRLVRKTFKSEAAARLWREDARVDLRRGVLVASRPTKLHEIGDAWLSAGLGGGIRHRSGDRYKPCTLRGHEQALREYIYPELGTAKLQDVRAGDVQRLVDRLVARGLNPSTVRNALLPLRAIWRRALRNGDINANPTAGVEIPAVRGRRTRIVTPLQALTLINNAPSEDRTL
jgi:integrase